MKTWVLTVLLASVSGLGMLSGCEPANGESQVPATPTVGTLAVVDLDEVARGLGKQADWKTDLETHWQKLQGEYAAMEQSLKGQLEEMQGKLGESPTDEQKRQLQAGIIQARQILQNADVQAKTLLQQRRNELISDFRNRLQPVVRKVADARGFDVVIVKGANVLSAADAADITQAVLTEAVTTIGKSSAASDAKAGNPATTPDANAVGE